MEVTDNPSLASFSYYVPETSSIWGPFCVDCMNSWYNDGGFPTDVHLFVHTKGRGVGLSLGKLIETNRETFPFSLRYSIPDLLVLNCSNEGCANCMRAVGKPNCVQNESTQTGRVKVPGKGTQTDEVLSNPSTIKREEIGSASVSNDSSLDSAKRIGILDGTTNAALEPLLAEELSERLIAIALLYDNSSDTFKADVETACRANNWKAEECGVCPDIQIGSHCLGHVLSNQHQRMLLKSGRFVTTEQLVPLEKLMATRLRSSKILPMLHGFFYGTKLSDDLLEKKLAHLRTAVSTLDVELLGKYVTEEFQEETECPICVVDLTNTTIIDHVLSQDHIDEIYECNNFITEWDVSTMQGFLNLVKKQVSGTATVNQVVQGSTAPAKKLSAPSSFKEIPKWPPFLYGHVKLSDAMSLDEIKAERASLFKEYMKVESNMNTVLRNHGFASQACSPCKAKFTGLGNMIQHGLSLAHITTIMNSGRKFSRYADVDFLRQMIKEANSMNSSQSTPKSTVPPPTLSTTSTTKMAVVQPTRQQPSSTSFATASSKVQSTSPSSSLASSASFTTTKEYPFLDGRLSVLDPLSVAEINAMLYPLRRDMEKVQSAMNTILKQRKHQLTRCVHCSVRFNGLVDVIAHCLKGSHRENVMNTGLSFSRSKDLHELLSLFREAREHVGIVGKCENVITAQGDFSSLPATSQAVVVPKKKEPSVAVVQPTTTSSVEPAVTLVKAPPPLIKEPIGSVSSPSSREYPFLTGRLSVDDVIPEAELKFYTDYHRQDFTSFQSSMNKLLKQQGYEITSCLSCGIPKFDGYVAAVSHCLTESHRYNISKQGRYFSRTKDLYELDRLVRESKDLMEQEKKDRKIAKRTSVFDIEPQCARVPQSTVPYPPESQPGLEAQASTSSTQLFEDIDEESLEDKMARPTEDTYSPLGVQLKGDDESDSSEPRDTLQCEYLVMDAVSPRPSTIPPSTTTVNTQARPQAAAPEKKEKNCIVS